MLSFEVYRHKKDDTISLLGDVRAGTLPDCMSTSISISCLSDPSIMKALITQITLSVKNLVFAGGDLVGKEAYVLMSGKVA